MTAPRDADKVRAFLARVSRRLTLLSAADGAAAGLGVAAVAAIAGWPQRGAVSTALVVGAALALLGIVASSLIARYRRPPVSLLVERRAPQCKNLVVTADELPHHHVTERVAAVVYTQAARVVDGLDLGALFPARRQLGVLAAAAVAWTFVATRSAAPVTESPRAIAGASTVGVTGIEVTIVPPAYTGRAPQTLRDPARVEALAGSRLRVNVRASAARVVVAMLRSTDTLAASNGDTFSTSVIADADGYVAIEPLGENGSTGARRLVGLTVIPDDAPRVRIVTPGRDLYLKDGHATLDVAVESSDDIGLASLEMKYTKVSGSGERFVFIEGKVPLTVVRRDARAWTARVRWPLDSLTLGTGDMVVYRAIAADHRPGATPSESDSYIAEVLSPGGNAAAGFALDPEQERYAVSQQMVILKTERLKAQKPTLSDEDYLKASMELAAEQRKVRAEFVFMMGGELADAPDPNADMTMLNEEAEAEGEHDLAAGHNLSSGRIALQSAIRAMSRAAQSLNNADLTTALSHERAALVQLERAFARTRIILRALTERERLDLSRRLTGVLTEAARDTRPRFTPDADARTITLRRALAGIAALAGEPTPPADAAARASMLAESALRADASSKEVQDAATLLGSASSAFARGRASEARTLLDRAATSIAAAVRANLLGAPSAASSDLDRLGGALGDALRSSRGGAR